MPEPVREDGVVRNCAWLQVTDAEDFSRLLRVNGTTKRNELGEKGKDGDLSLLCLSLFSHSSLAPPFHLITLSARNSMDCGIVRPICLAVFRLILSSNFVGASTGKPAASRPLESYPRRRQRGGDGKDLFIELGSPTLREEPTRITNI